MIAGYPFVQVVVVAKNEEKHIQRCLDSLKGLDYPKDRYETIVIDGSSRDKTVDIVRRNGVKVIIDNAGGLAHSRNLGLKVTNWKYIAFTDADCIVKEDWLKKMIESITDAPEDVVAVGGPNEICPDDSPFARLIGFMQETFLASGGAPQSFKINTDRYVFSIHNSNILYKRDILLKEGGYNDAFNVGEDAELNFRLWRKGYRFLYRLDIIVWHHRPGNLKDFTRKMFTYGESMAKITRLHKSVVRWYSFLPVLIIIGMLLALPLVVLLPPIAYFYLAVLIIYLAGLAFSALHVFVSYKGVGALLTFMLLPVQHLSYGFGFIKGCIVG